MRKTKEQISYNMSRIKSKDTKIELILRKALWTKGLRYRKNVNGIIGHPDIAFKGKKVALPILRHRIIKNYKAEADGLDVDEIIMKLL